MANSENKITKEMKSNRIASECIKIMLKDNSKSILEIRNKINKQFGVKYSVSYIAKLLKQSNKKVFKKNIDMLEDYWGISNLLLDEITEKAVDFLSNTRNIDDLTKASSIILEVVGKRAKICGFDNGTKIVMGDIKNIQNNYNNSVFSIERQKKITSEIRTKYKEVLGKAECN